MRIYGRQQPYFPHAVPVPVSFSAINLYTYGDGSSGKKKGEKKKEEGKKKERRRLQVRSSLYANNNTTCRYSTPLHLFSRIGVAHTHTHTNPPPPSSLK